MEPRLTPEVDGYLDDVLERLLTNSVQLWELPTSVTSIYYLGESCAYQVMNVQLANVQAERDRYYRAACAGGFTTYLKPQGLTYWQLCAERGDMERARQVKADMEALTFQVGGVR